jgi:hypothetical protein
MKNSDVPVVYVIPWHAAGNDPSERFMIGNLHVSVLTLVAQYKYLIRPIDINWFS